MILKLEHQVASLESCKRLKELGFPQASLFYWEEAVSTIDRSRVHHLIPFERSTPSMDVCYSAYTCSELGELLPAGFMHKKKVYSIEMSKFGKPWKYRIQGRYYSLPYDDGTRSTLDIPFEAIVEENEVEARAKMLIYLAENGLIEKNPC